MLRQIQYFQAVVRHNSFSEAAEECHISQSAISQQVKALEQELGFQLLERHNRSFTLTSAGAYFQTVVGFRGTFLFANTLEEARLFVASGQGFLPVTEKSLATSEDTIRRLPLYRNDAPIHQKLCLFWKKENSGYYVESFADCLKARFTT